MFVPTTDITHDYIGGSTEIHWVGHEASTGSLLLAAMYLLTPLLDCWGVVVLMLYLEHVATAVELVLQLDGCGFLHIGSLLLTIIRSSMGVIWTLTKGASLDCYYISSYLAAYTASTYWYRSSRSCTLKHSELSTVYKILQVYMCDVTCVQTCK